MTFSPLFLDFLKEGMGFVDNTSLLVKHRDGPWVPLVAFSSRQIPWHSHSASERKSFQGWYIHSLVLLPQQCTCICGKVNIYNAKNMTSSLRKQGASFVLRPWLSWCFITKFVSCITPGAKAPQDSQVVFGLSRKYWVHVKSSESDLKGEEQHYQTNTLNWNF